MILFLFAGCKKDFDKILTPNWSPVFSFPLVQSCISLGDLIEEDSNIVINPDSSIKLVYVEDSVVEIQVDDVFSIPEQDPVKESVKLGNIELEEYTFSIDFTINDMIDYFDPDVKDTLLKYEGQKTIYPPLEIGQSIKSEEKVLEDFVHIDISEGIMQFSLKNNLEVLIEEVELKVINSSSQTELFTFRFLNMQPGELRIDSANLAGYQVSNSFHVVNSVFRTQTSYPDSLLLDFSDGLSSEVILKNVKIDNGTVIIRETIERSEKEYAGFNVAQDARINEIALDNASIEFIVISALPLAVDLKIRLSSASASGGIPEQSFTLPPNGTYMNTWNLNDLTIDLTGNPEHPYNQFPVEYEVFIHNTDDFVEISALDSLAVNLQVIDLDFRYAEGYFGQKAFEIETDSLILDVEFLEHFSGGLVLTDPQIKLRYLNSVGVPVKLDLDITGYNNNGSFNELITNPLHFLSPQSQGSFISDSIIIDKTNSNIVDFISMSPDAIKAGGEALSNPQGIQNNFIYDTCSFVSGIYMDLPLSLHAENLKFMDTIQVNVNEGDTERFKSGVFYFNIENGFPFEINLDFLILDSLNQNVTEIIDLGTIASPTINSHGEVIKNEKTYVSVNFPSSTFHNLKSSNFGIFRAVMNTDNQQGYPSVLFTNNEMRVKMGIEVQFKPF